VLSRSLTCCLTGPISDTASIDLVPHDDNILESKTIVNAKTAPPENTWPAKSRVDILGFIVHYVTSSHAGRMSWSCKRGRFCIYSHSKKTDGGKLRSEPALVSIHPLVLVVGTDSSLATIFFATTQIPWLQCQQIQRRSSQNYRIGQPMLLSKKVTIAFNRWSNLTIRQNCYMPSAVDSCQKPRFL
jgi:hypothetical protein